MPLRRCAEMTFVHWLAQKRLWQALLCWVEGQQPDRAAQLEGPTLRFARARPCQALPCTKCYRSWPCPQSCPRTFLEQSASTAYVHGRLRQSRAAGGACIVAFAPRTAPHRCSRGVCTRTTSYAHCLSGSVKGARVRCCQPLWVVLIAAGHTRSQRARSPDRSRGLRSWRARELARAAMY